MTRRYGVPAALFSLKCFVAAMLAYWIALRIGLTRPFWAVATSYIVAQPLAGAVVSKAVFRVIGTVIGAAAAVVMVPNLVDAPELLSLALALWLGLCLFVALQDRTPRSYIFLLAGYTASIIGFPSVETPGAIFDVASLRTQEITLGILCSSAVHAFVFPQTVTKQLLARVDAILADVEKWTRDSLGEAASTTLDKERRRLALDVNELHQLSIHLPFDPARFLPSVRVVRALQDQLSLILPVASAVEDRILALRSLGALPPAVEALVARIRHWLEMPPLSVAERATVVETLIADARALEPEGAAPLSWEAVLRISLTARLGELVAAHRAARDLRDQLHAPTRAAVAPEIPAMLRQTSRRTFHLDRAVGLRTALGAVATILIGCVFWIATGWPEGAEAVLIAGVVCALFGANDDPGAQIKTFLWGAMIGIAAATVYAFAIFPSVSDFVTVAAVLAPFYLAVGTALYEPRTARMAVGAHIGFINVVGLGSHYAADFAAFANGALALIIGVGFTVITVGLFQKVGADKSAARIIRAGWRDLARRSNLPGPPDLAGWISRMLDRIALLAPRFAAMGENPGKPMLDALKDLRVGIAVAGLRQVRFESGAAGKARLTPLLAGIAAHYAAMRMDRKPEENPELLAMIDNAMGGYAHDADRARRRAALLALTSLRRNLFPAAPPFESVPA